jgi:hypothetical protein
MAPGPEWPRKIRHQLPIGALMPEEREVPNSIKGHAKPQGMCWWSGLTPCEDG